VSSNFTGTTKIEHPKRRVFRRLQKTDSADVTWRSRAFHVLAAVIGKAQSSTVDSRVRRTGSDNVDADPNISKE